MPTDYYDDGPALPPAPENEAPKRPDEDSESDDTAILPKSILAGKDFEPGDEVVLRIVRIHDDSVEVAYAPEKKSDEGKEEDQAGPMHEMDEDPMMA